MQVGRLEVKQKEKRGKGKREKGKKEKGKRKKETETEKEKGDGNGKTKRKEKEESSQSIFRLVPKYMYVYTHLGLWLDWLLLLWLLLGSFTSRLHSFPSPSLSLSLYPRSIFHIHSSFKGKKDYLLLVLWACGLV